MKNSPIRNNDAWLKQPEGRALFMSQRQERLKAWRDEANPVLAIAQGAQDGQHRHGSRTMNDITISDSSHRHGQPKEFVVSSSMSVALHKTHEMDVPWLYIGSELGDSVDFQKVRLVMALGLYARDGQHRHGVG